MNQEKIDFDLSFFNIFKLKEINVNVISKTKVIPMGNAIGMKLYTDGVLVVGMSEIEGKKPYENSGIKEGDRIVQIDKKAIDNTEDLMEAVNKCSGKEISVKYIRDNTTITTSIKPIKIVAINIKQDYGLEMQQQEQEHLHFMGTKFWNVWNSWTWNT